MIRCDRSQNLFARAWDDELSVAERDSLESHLGACVPCRREYDEYARTLELVQALPRPVVSGDFATRVVSAARRREAETGVAARLGRSGWAFGLAPRSALALAAAFLVVLGAGGVAFYAQHSPSPAQTAAHSPERLPDIRGDIATAPQASVPTNGAPNVSQRIASLDAAPGARATVATVASATPRTHAGSDAIADASTLPDSLFDHAADVEFVLDPVKLRRERGRGYTPVPTTVRGEAASITF